MDDKEKEEVCVLKELKEAIKDIGRDDPKFLLDAYLLRWLRAGNKKCLMPWRKAEKLIRNSYNWRRTHNYEDTRDYEGVPEVAKPFFKFQSDCTALDGSPVFQFDGGAMDPQGALQAVGREPLVRMWLQEYLKFEQKFLDVNRHYRHGERVGNEHPGVKGASVIIDSRSMSLRHLAFGPLKLYLDIVGPITTYFTAFVDHAYFLNVNRWAASLLKIVRPLIDRVGIEITVFQEQDPLRQEMLLHQVVHPKELWAPTGTKDEAKQLIVPYQNSTKN